MRYMIYGILIATALGAASQLQCAEPAANKPSLQAAKAKLKVPPDWFAQVHPQWDMARPWEDGRMEIRRLLALSDDPQKIREAVKLTWMYAQKGDIGNGHELPMYLFMSGNYAWAIEEYPKYLARKIEKGPTHAYRCYASCFAHFGEYQKALEVLDRAMKDLALPPWRVSAEAGLHEHYGDIYAEVGQAGKAKVEYAKAMRLLPTSPQPFGRHLIPRQVGKIQAKLDLLTMQSLATAKLRDGKYVGRALGYVDKTDMLVTVTIQSGKIADVAVKHEEKIELNATKLIPQQIVQKQSLRVDVVTGATVTSQAIVNGAFKAIKQAGLK